MAENDTGKPADFIRVKIDADVASGKYDRAIKTRFPPEPNGYLHIGHAKAICLNFGIASEWPGATCNLRFDDTNPTRENMEFVEAIKGDIRWLGFEWDGEARFASDYFERMYGFAVNLIESGKAYVCELSLEEIREYRGSVTEPGRNSPYRDRPVDENLDLFSRMRAGEFDDGQMVLRARIDMSAPNMLMRDPILYRIRRVHHYRTGDEWCIYPMYDFAHCLGDAVEGVTHSLCSLEFKDNRELYDWVVHEVGFVQPPEQTEFARFNLEYTVLSKRKLIRLVDEGHVSGWDDPRMPTLAGLRRRGVPAAAIRNLCDMVGVARVPNRIDMAKLEFAIRDSLNHEVSRVLCVLRPLKVVITNFTEGDIETLDAPLYPHDVPKVGSRALPFTRDLYIERDDFAEDPPKGFFRMAPGSEVRLRYAYLVTCTEVIKNDEGEISEIHCVYDPDSRGGNAPDGRKVKGTIHWVSASESLPCEVRLYDRLFSVPAPDEVGEDGDFVDYLNPTSVEVLGQARVEPFVGDHPAGTSYQFERQGYFISDVGRSGGREVGKAGENSGGLVFNRIVPLRDTWAKRSAGRGSANEPSESGPAARKAKGIKADSKAVLPDLTGEQLVVVKRYTEQLDLSASDARLIVSQPEVFSFFESVLEHGADPVLAANLTVNEMSRSDRGVSLAEIPFGGKDFAELVTLLSQSKITRGAARRVLDEMFETGRDPGSIVAQKGLATISDSGDLAPVIAEVVGHHRVELEAYRGGKKALFGFFMGEVMKATDGRADPAMVKTALQQALEG